MKVLKPALHPELSRCDILTLFLCNLGESQLNQSRRCFRCVEMARNVHSVPLTRAASTNSGRSGDHVPRQDSICCSVQLVEKSWNGVICTAGSLDSLPRYDCSVAEHLMSNASVTFK